MDSLQLELVRMQKATLSNSVKDVDKIIDLLVSARDQVANAADPHTASLTMTKLQNPIKEGFEALNDNLREVSKGQKNFGKVLDKVLPQRNLPTDYDVMENHTALINRAVVMHLLREGEFSVADDFLREATDFPPQIALPPSTTEDQHLLDEDTDMANGGTEDEEKAAQSNGVAPTSAAAPPPDLHASFARMYAILDKLRSHRNLVPAIEWARQNSAELEARGSNLEFELARLQFVWLFKGPAVNGLPDDAGNGRRGALAYARQNFARFQRRHLRPIQRLFGAMVYAPNLPASPYADVFAADPAFADAAASFTREFCSLLGLSAESPLYLAATAGAIALPQLLKYTTHARQSRTEWTTENELAFETPLPARMVYHPIFVCPVSKEQTTDANPPMMLPCGHVVCKDSLHRLTKGSRFKCPYCPNEGQLRDAREIIL